MERRDGVVVMVADSGGAEPWGLRFRGAAVESCTFRAFVLA